MTLQAELDKDAQRIEWILCVEGVGWGNATDGFHGHLFVTADLDTNLATELTNASTPTIHKTLALPRSISDSIDPLSASYQHGGMVFEIQDDETTFLTTKFRPHISGTETTLSAALGWRGTEPYLTDGTGFANGDVVWVGGREAILLAGKTNTAGTEYKFTGSTRGYAGTERGRLAPFPTTAADMAWPTGTAVFAHDRYMHNRKVRLWAHVPHETYASCVLMYSGRIRGDKLTMGGRGIELMTVHDDCTVIRLRKAPTRTTVTSDRHVVELHYGAEQTLLSIDQHLALYGAWGVGSACLLAKHEVALSTIGGGNLADWYASLFALYNYRRVVGGTAGVITAYRTSSSAPQAVVASSLYRCDTLIKIGDAVGRAEYKVDGFDDKKIVVSGSLDPPPQFELTTGDVYAAGATVRFLLDNLSDDHEASRFAIDNVVQRDVLRVALMFLTTMNGEFFVGDTSANGAAGGTTAVFAASTFTTDQFAGYWAYIPEGTNIGETREIASNTTTTLTFTTAFTGQVVSGVEVQIRNSRYDCLPLGWGMCVHHDNIDVAEFERLQDKYLSGVKVGRFAIGDEEVTDLYGFVCEQILRPFGVVLINSRTTGKITPKYIGEILPDGLVTDYVDVAAKQILDMGDLDRAPQPPIGRIQLEVRKSGMAVVSRTVDAGPATFTVSAQQRVGGVLLGDSTEMIDIQANELRDVFYDTELDTMKVSATVLDRNDPATAWLLALLTARLKRYAQPPPVVSLKLDPSFLLTVQAGTMLSLTDATRNPYDPHTGNFGWSSRPGLVLSSELVLTGEYGLRVTVQLWPTSLAAKIAPAATPSGTGAAGGHGYFEVNDADFVTDSTAHDWDLFAADDYIGHFSASGALRTSYQIDHVDSAVSPVRIYVDAAAIADALVAGDYVSYYVWDGSQSNAQQLFACYADASEGLGPVPDTARDYT